MRWREKEVEAPQISVSQRRECVFHQTNSGVWGTSQWKLIGKYDEQLIIPGGTKEELSWCNSVRMSGVSAETGRDYGAIVRGVLKRNKSFKLHNGLQDFKHRIKSMKRCTGVEHDVNKWRRGGVHHPQRDSKEHFFYWITDWKHLFDSQFSWVRQWTNHCLKTILKDLLTKRIFQTNHFTEWILLIQYTWKYWFAHHYQQKDTFDTTTTSVTALFYYTVPRFHLSRLYPLFSRGTWYCFFVPTPSRFQARLHGVFCV